MTRYLVGLVLLGLAAVACSHQEPPPQPGPAPKPEGTEPNGSATGTFGLLDREYPQLEYSGDGKFFDAGRRAGIDRFVLDLGEVDLNRPSAQSYDLVGLPETSFVCYVRVEYPLPLSGQPPRDLDWGRTELTMRVVDGSGTEVFSDTAPISKWIWSGTVGASQTDLYRRSTQFTPVQGTSYKLALEVSPASADAPNARLLLMGGGWKSN